MDDNELQKAITDAVTPRWSEVTRAKGLILDALAEGVRGVGNLQGCLLLAEGLPLRPPESRHHEIDTEQWDPGDQHPATTHARLAIAATEALIDLVSLGLVVPVSDGPTYESSHPIYKRELAVHVNRRGHRSGIRVRINDPSLSEAYRLAPRLHNEAPWMLDPNIFVADLDELELPARTKRCIDEALAAYRGSLFLAAMNMLGAASEGAWYAAGERLRTLDQRLAAALDSNDTQKVVKLVAERLRSSKRDGLLASASHLTWLRNYGVHPRDDDDSAIERHFDETAAAAQLLAAHGYLTRLSTEVRRAVERASGGDEG